MEHKKPWTHGKLVVTENGRYVRHEDGTPFFWLGDTAWLLLKRTTREQALVYLRDRKEKGFNVIQIMLVHDLESKNAYGRTPFHELDLKRPDAESSNDVESYWSYANEVIELAEREGLYVALVPVWGSVVEHYSPDAEAAERYGEWLGQRYKDRPNVIWLNGGDIRGSDYTDVWLHLGRVLRRTAPNHLMTFHPFGRSQSSAWFHQEEWLDFNMFQSGHRSYQQMEEDKPDTLAGEDNWRFVQTDWAKTPAKPTIDGEPSYEDIPHGLHFPDAPRWTADDVRRYAYWAVFAGAFGHTYGHNSVMQFHTADRGVGAYNCTRSWTEALNDEGAKQMIHLKRLALSRLCEDRMPDEAAIDGDPGFRYDRLFVLRSKSSLMAYTYTGRTFTLRLGLISGERVSVWWYNPRTGESEHAGEAANKGVREFIPPTASSPGRDWVLVLDDADRGFAAPGQLD
ncbi:glycoside hydrolase family 140 protein [Paenibacillus sp. HB172176]|uniref:glycoside hydrolase family 140 protein n=1 Tax=Paenibacillus sp. HB172176 TaxID=2493690 RepID=UPI001439E8ED|nr:glycoside hydrolase family 140 protein [Paenibacillus sp. HB172176]